jgi:hypothetical protein
MKRISELRSDFTDESLIHIDAWFTGNDDEVGVTLATVNEITKEVIILDERYTNDEILTEQIKYSLSQM